MSDVGVGGVVFNVIAGFLSDSVPRVLADGVCSEVVRIVLRILQGRVLGPLLCYCTRVICL